MLRFEILLVALACWAVCHVYATASGSCCSDSFVIGGGDGNPIFQVTSSDQTCTCFGPSQLVGGASVGPGGTMLRSLRHLIVEVGAYASAEQTVGAVRFWVDFGCNFADPRTLNIVGSVVSRSATDANASYTVTFDQPQTNGTYFVLVRNDRPGAGWEDATVQVHLSIAEVYGISSVTAIPVPVTAPYNLFAWGYNDYGELGDGSNTSQPTPVVVSTPETWLDKTVILVAAGFSHSVSLLSDGSVFAWGSNDYGQVGDGSNITRLTPVAVSFPAPRSGKMVTLVSAGYCHSLAVLSDGSVYAWGYNMYGQLGDGSNASSLTPVAIAKPGSWLSKTVTRVAAGYFHSLALLSDGSVFAWGNNDNGQLGDGSDTTRLAPVAVSAPASWFGKNVTDVTLGALHSVALLSDGSVYAWGGNVFGQLGDGSKNGSLIPVAVYVPSSWPNEAVTVVVSGGYHSVALLSNGSLFAWGYNPTGDGDWLAPMEIPAPASWFGKTVTQVAAGFFHSVALLSDGSVYTWGQNEYGQLGDGSNASQPIPVPVAPDAWSGRAVTCIFSGPIAYSSFAVVE